MLSYPITRRLAAVTSSAPSLSSRLVQSTRRAVRPSATRTYVLTPEPEANLTDYYSEFKHIHETPVQQALAQIPQLPSNPRIFDLNCAMGASTNVLAAKYPDASLTVVEKDPEMLAYTRNNLLDAINATFVEGEATSFTLPPGSEPADLVFAQDATGTLPTNKTNTSDCIRMLNELVRPGGGVFALSVDWSWKAAETVIRGAATDEIKWATDEFWTKYIKYIPFGQKPEGTRAWQTALSPLCSSVSTARWMYTVALPKEDAIRFTLGLQFRRLVTDAPPSLQQKYVMLMRRMMANDREGLFTLDDGRYLVPVEKNFVIAVKK